MVAWGLEAGEGVRVWGARFRENVGEWSVVAAKGVDWAGRP